MTPMWCDVLDEWIARQRCVVVLSVGGAGGWPLVTARRMYSPANLVKGTRIRSPLGRGGDTMLSFLPNRHSVCELPHYWETDSNDSPKVGTQQTPLKTTRITLPDSSFTKTGKSPMTVQSCGLPSMPAMVSFEARVLIRSSRRVHVPRTPAVNDESNATRPVGQASIVSTRVTLRVSGEQDTRMRSEGEGHRGAGPRSGTRRCSVRVSFHAWRGPERFVHSIEESEVQCIVQGLVSCGDAFEHVATA
eukprot:1365861-Pleurochrysis_carterae.AAC.2